MALVVCLITSRPSSATSWHRPIGVSLRLLCDGATRDSEYWRSMLRLSHDDMWLDIVTVSDNDEPDYC